MHSSRDPALWSELEAVIVRLFKPLVPGAEQSLSVTVKIQDGLPVAFFIRTTLERRPGTFDRAATQDVIELVPLLARHHAVPVRYGQARFRLRGWKLMASSVTKTQRRGKAG